MEPGEEPADWSPYQPECLVQALRCPVCLDYFRQPHTLACGHSFCLKCLRTLAKLTRTSRIRAPLDRLRMRCPSCRKLTPARSILRRRASVNYALKELVNEWFNSPYATGSIDYITLRSVGTQTDEETKPANKSPINKSPVNKSPVNKSSLNHKRSESTDDEPETSDDISAIQFRRILFHKIEPKAEVIKDIDADNDVDVTTESSPFTTAGEDSAASDDNFVSSSSEEESEPEVIPLLADLRVINDDQNAVRRRRLSIFDVMSTARVIGIFLTEFGILWRGIVTSRSRLALTMFWFIYGGLVVCVSRGFFPWMAIYTVIYFVILYADISYPTHV